MHKSFFNFINKNLINFVGLINRMIIVYEIVEDMSDKTVKITRKIH